MLMHQAWVKKLEGLPLSNDKNIISNDVHINCPIGTVWKQSNYYQIGYDSGSVSKNRCGCTQYRNGQCWCWPEIQFE